MQSVSFSRIILGIAMCATMALPAYAGDSSHLVAASKGQSKKAAAAPSAGDLQAQLEDFGRKHLQNMNKNCIKSSTSRTEYDLKSLKTHYKPSANPAVQYIGYLEYDELTYPCNTCPPRRDRMTELIMYVHGKWTY